MESVAEFLIPVLGMLCLFVIMPAIISYSIFQEKKLKLQRELAKSGGAETRAEVEDLRVRVAVLERLVTDGDRNLAGEIDRLARADAAKRPL